MLVNVLLFVLGLVVGACIGVWALAVLLAGALGIGPGSRW